MTTFTKDPSTHPANGQLTQERLIRVRDELAAAAIRSDGGNLGYMMADGAKAIDELLAWRSAPQLPQPVHVSVDFALIRCALANAGVAAPESDEELGSSHIRQILKFVAEREA
ncbi:hypothetical protein [Leclercia adecarboxylata]|uniref:hypothetical protein n=1 Tax=Leclercia adecarboxylata TaxID=83655 RepID=UPI0013FD297E|nr:hypothetical protein [Leclercia adecarboxylata]QIM43331.1 hypothetical protein G7098_11475 [Leclercia adecarboxylata]